MKKFLVIALSLSLVCIFLTACGKPADMDDTTYNLGKEAVEEGNNYLGGKTSLSDAAKKLQHIYEELAAYTPTNSLNHYFVKSAVGDMQRALEYEKISSEVSFKDKFEEGLNKLKGRL